jgi:hypothetical protein
MNKLSKKQVSYLKNLEKKKTDYGIIQLFKYFMEWIIMSFFYVFNEIA